MPTKEYRGHLGPELPLGWSMCVTLARWLDAIPIQFIHNECRSFIVPSVHQLSLSLRAMASLLLIESQLSSLFHPISDPGIR